MLLGTKLLVAVVLACLCHSDALQRQTPSWYNTRGRRLWLINRIDHKRRQCVVDYRERFNFNTIFTVSRGGHCMKFYCSPRFGVRLISTRSGCPYNDKCIKRGGQITEDCATYECYFWSRKTRTHVSFQNIWYLRKEGCLNRGKCLALREKFLDTKYCGVYVCYKKYAAGKAKYNMVLTENRCPYLGNCIVIDKRYILQFKGICNIIQCKYKKTNEGNMTLNILENRCEEPDGTCSREGTIKQADDCYRARCKSLSDGRAYYHTEYRNTLACRRKYG